MSICIKEAFLSVCLSVCLFGFGAQCTRWISTKFGMGHPMGPVGNLNKGGIILEKVKKSKLSP